MIAKIANATEGARCTYAPRLDTDMMTQPTVVFVVDDNADILKSVAKLLAGLTTK